MAALRSLSPRVDSDWYSITPGNRRSGFGSSVECRDLSPLEFGTASEREVAVKIQWRRNDKRRQVAHSTCFVGRDKPGIAEVWCPSTLRLPA